MKKTILAAALLLTTGLGATAQDWPEDMRRLSCTSIMVGRQASADGSVITSHTCDSWYRTWMSIVPAADHKEGELTTIFDGLMHTQASTDSTKVHALGTIPQAAHTYRFLNTAYPCLNERQLAMGETTISGRDTLRNPKGMFRIEELQRVALQRCSTAREAIRLMGRMVKEYGYGDGGECLTVADKNEVWIFEVFGEGPKKLGGVWAAQRIPDDHIAVSANISRIGALNLADTLNFMASENVYDVARRLKLWDGREPFSFWRAYSGGNYFGEPKNYSVREHFIMKTLAPSLCLSDTVSELPVSIRPDKKVSARDVMELLAQYYEGDTLDMTAPLRVESKKSDTGYRVSPVANPWMRGDAIELYNALIDSTGHRVRSVRPVAVAWCAYSTVIQLRSWLPDEIGGVAWVALDNPAESPRFPIFCGNTALPKLLDICGQHVDRDDAALWHYRKANRLATIRWGADRTMVEGARRYFIDKAERELPFVEQTWQTLSTPANDPAAASNANPDAAAAANANLNASRDARAAATPDPAAARTAATPDAAAARTFLDGYTADFFGATITRWDEFARTLWRKHWSGF